MKLDKKIVTVFVLASFVIAGTALASFITTTSTESITIGSGKDTAVTVSRTTSTLESSTGKANVVPVNVVASAPEAILANAIFRILEIPVTIQDITSLRVRNIGNGEIALAYNLAYASGRPVNEILDMRFNDKMGWGKIAKVLGVKLNKSVSHTEYILREAKLDNDANNLQVFLKVDLDQENDDHNDKVGKEKHSYSDKHKSDNNEGQKEHQDNRNNNSRSKKLHGKDKDNGKND